MANPREPADHPEYPPREADRPHQAPQANCLTISRAEDTQSPVVRQELLSHGICGKHRGIAIATISRIPKADRRTTRPPVAEAAAHGRIQGTNLDINSRAEKHGKMQQIERMRHLKNLLLFARLSRTEANATIAPMTRRPPEPHPPTVDDAIRDQKRRCRHMALAARRGLRHRASADRVITEHVVGRLEFLRAATLLCYVSLPDEARTDEIILAAQRAGKRVAVPYCLSDGRLGLFRLDHLDDLAPSRFGLREPRGAIREDPARQVLPEDLQLMIVPGVAFDPHGNRLGFGKGYFDRLLRHASEATKIGLAYEVQILPAVPVLDHDVRMDYVITEQAVYHLGRRYLHPRRDDPSSLH